MKKIGFYLIIVGFVIANIVLLYFIAVNTILADKVLPNIKFGNIDASFLPASEAETLVNNLYADLPEYLTVKVEDQVSEIKIADLDIQFKDEEIVAYGKGTDLVKVISDGLNLFNGVEFKDMYTMSTNPVIRLAGINITDKDFAYLQNEKLFNCNKSNYNFNIQNDLLKQELFESIKNRSVFEFDIAKYITSDESKLLSMCKDLIRKSDHFKTIFTEYQESGNWESFIDHIVSNSQARFYISNNKNLQDFLIDLKSRLDVPPNEGSYEVIHDKVYLLSMYKVGKKLNIELTSNEIVNWLNNPTDQIPFKYDEIKPSLFNLGLEVIDFTKLMGSGKTRIDLIRNGDANYAVTYAEYGLIELQNLVVNPGEEFSYIKHIDPQPDGTTKNGYPIAAGICNSTTTLFRAVLESGLQITDRAYHYWNVPSYDWPYQMNIVDAAYFTDPIVDLKFKNNTNYPILLKLDFYKEDGYQYHTINVFTSSQAPERKVELTNWKKWNVYGERIFEASFDRLVYENGVKISEDNFYSKYL
jgi:vancomycin resistance protein YoaR